MPFRKKLHSAPNTVSPDLAPMLERWLLVLLVPLGGHREFLLRNGFRDEGIAEALGLINDQDYDEFSYDPAQVLATLRRRYRRLQQPLPQEDRMPLPLRANLHQLAEWVGLSAVDCRLLEFAVLVHTERLLDDAGDLLGNLSSGKLMRVLAALIDYPEAAVQAALGPQGVLARTGLLTLDRIGTGPLRTRLDLLSPQFANHLCHTEADPMHLLRDRLFPSEPAQLAETDFVHISAFLRVAQPYLRRGLQEARKGMNILLHGSPGTGKTELARWLAQEQGCTLYEIASADEEGAPVAGEHRLRAFGAAQSFLAQRQALILFDEVEDVFSEPFIGFGMRRSVPLRKAWINRMLQENPIPAFWITNSLQDMDPAILRRFDLVQELPVPPRQVRAKILGQHSAAWLSPTGIARLAEAEALAPALVTRTASVIQSIQSDLPPEQAATAFEQLLNQTLTAQRLPRIPTSPGLGVADVYDPAFLHTDADLETVVTGLQQVGEGRLCLYGPPGTGKTAWARWLAHTLNRPLQVQRASDLLSKWLGESEQNLAKVFQMAEREKAVLLIDEVDSFLHGRGHSQQSWEVTLVNEMLTQMERYAGIFIASTNRLDALDEASLRRFDLKVHFDVLRPDQIRALAERYLSCLGLEEIDSVSPVPWEHLGAVTPGDFAAIIRQHRFRPLQNAQDLFQRLQAECALKTGNRRAIGFQ